MGEEVRGGTRPRAPPVSTLWNFFFHAVENFIRVFPCRGNNGRDFSMPWKTFFHAMENDAKKRLAMRRTGR